MKILEGREQDYKDWLDKNTDPYGRACFTYAERWAEMLESLIESSADEPMKVVVDNADRLSHEADVEGITGFMYGCAVSILSQCWKYGEELKKWHNKEYKKMGELHESIFSRATCKRLVSRLCNGNYCRR